MLYQAFQQGMRLSGALLENVGHLYTNALFLSNLFEFLALEPAIVSPDPGSPRFRPAGDPFQKRLFPVSRN